MLKAIETEYKGYRFRSRLEARWAVFFDALGIAWRYEVEGFELDRGIRYLPDFYIPDWDCFIEVKPELPVVMFPVLLQGGDEAFRKFAYSKDGDFYRFSTASRSLAICDDSGIPRPRLYMLCGSPGPLVLQYVAGSFPAFSAGTWKLREGSVALCQSVAKGVPPFVFMHSWSESHGNKSIDLWRHYIDMPVVANGATAECALFPDGRLLFAYMGQGRTQDSPRIQDAYRAARGARFEHGETPNLDRSHQ